MDKLTRVAFIYLFFSNAEQHSTEVENALYADEPILDAAAVSVPDKRPGELIATVVTAWEHFKGLVTGERD